MSTSLSPNTFICPVCRWQSTALFAGDGQLFDFYWFSSCPQCGCETLDSRPASRVEIMNARLEEFFKNESRN